MVNVVNALLRHRVTYRFLMVLCATIGVASLTGDTFSALESLVCSILACSD